MNALGNVAEFLLIIFSLTGLVTIIIGWEISRLYSIKECPSCQEIGEYAALKCQHCGHAFEDEFIEAYR